MIPDFQSSFFSQAMHQLFNSKGAPGPVNENEPPLRKYLRLAGQL